MVAEVALMVVGIGLSILSSYMLKPKDPIGKDDKPTTLATRGTFAPWVRGIRRVGPTICWIGDRGYYEEAVEGGGKGLLAPERTQFVYIEQGMHVICSGTAFSLQEITQNGELILGGVLNSDLFPSGSQITLGKEGNFRIYWGGPDQDGADPDPLVSADLGVDSVFPYFCYVVWNSKRLGTSPTWPSIEYTIECLCENSTLVESVPYEDPTFELQAYDPGVSGTGSRLVYQVQYGVQGVGYFEVEGRDTGHYFYGGKIRVVDHPTIADADFVILSAPEAVYLESRPLLDEGGNPVLNEIGNPMTITIPHSTIKIFPIGGVPAPYGTTPGGQAVAYTRGVLQGINVAHGIEEMLFAPYPIGAALERKFWDQDSLEALGVVLADERLGGSLISQSGATVRDVLGPALQDLTCVLPVDTSTGKLAFRPVREVAASDGHLSEDVMLSPLPSRKVRLTDLPADKLTFTWPDRTINYRDMTATIDDDGRATQTDAPKNRGIRLSICVEYESGLKIASRRALEEYGGKSAYTLYASRGARDLIPGDVITAYDFDEVLRVVGVQADTETSRVEVSCIPDFFGQPVENYLPDSPGLDTTRRPVANDFSYALVEAPSIITGDDSRVILFMPRIRTDARARAGAAYLSADDSTFTLIGYEPTPSGGGVLSEDLASDGATLLTTLAFYSTSIDTSSMPDYSGDDTSWRSGQLMAILVNPDGDQEIMFVQSVSVVSGNRYVANNVLRARYDTEKGDFGSGSILFLMTQDGASPLESTLAVPDSTRYLKGVTVGPLPLAVASVPSQEITIYGKGLRPMPIRNLRVSSPRPAVNNYHTGEDMEFSWSYQSFNYRAACPALLPAGAARGAIGFEGSFFVEMLTSGGVIVATYNSTTASIAYTNAQLVADFGSEPASFKIRVSASVNGRTSSSLTTTVTKD